MRDRYFSMYQSIEYKTCFYRVHSENAHRWYSLYTAATLSLSILSVLIWSISRTMPALWAILIAAAQFAQAYSSHLPWAAQLTALKYLLPELDQLVLDIDHDWLLIDMNVHKEPEILEFISAYERRYSLLEMQFASGVSFPQRGYILEKAEKAQRQYFYVRYPIIEELERSKERNGGKDTAFAPERR